VRYSVEMAKVFIDSVGEVEFKTDVNILKKTNHLDILIPEVRSLNLSNAIILDAGCGTGIISNEVWENRYTTIGMDISRRHIKIGKRIFRNVLFVLGDLHHIPFRDNSLDTIIFHSVLTYVKASIVLSEVARAGKNKCFLILCEFNPSNPLVRKNRGWGSRQLISLKEYSTMLHKNRINILKTNFIDFTPTTLKFKHGFFISLLRSSLSLLEKTIKKVPLVNHYGGFIFISAQKA